MCSIHLKKYNKLDEANNKLFAPTNKLFPTTTNLLFPLNKFSKLLVKGKCDLARLISNLHIFCKLLHLIYKTKIRQILVYMREITIFESML